MYTSNKNSDNPSDPAAGAKLLPVVFQGDSKRGLQGFPDGGKNDLGYALYRLQLGQAPPDRKPVQAVGAGVYELREGDARAWYRVLYAPEARTGSRTRGKEECQTSAPRKMSTGLQGACWMNSGWIDRQRWSSN